MASESNLHLAWRDLGIEIENTEEKLAVWRQIAHDLYWEKPNSKERYRKEIKNERPI